MATRPVQDAVDRNSGAKVYLTGHAQVTFMADGRSVEDAVNEKVTASQVQELINSAIITALNTAV